jgi:hypothetical protein
MSYHCYLGNSLSSTSRFGGVYNPYSPAFILEFLPFVCIPEPESSGVVISFQFLLLKWQLRTESKSSIKGSATVL